VQGRQKYIAETITTKLKNANGSNDVDNSRVNSKRRGNMSITAGSNIIRDPSNSRGVSGSRDINNSRVASKFASLESLYIFFLYKLNKVPKCECEVFDLFDFRDFYTIKPFWVDEAEIEILKIGPFCSTTGKPTHLFRTKCASLDSV
jgi:hypothetical protein